MTSPMKQDNPLYYGHIDKAATSELNAPYAKLHEPDTPPAKAGDVFVTLQPVNHFHNVVPVAGPAIPGSPHGIGVQDEPCCSVWFFLKLVPFHILNFVFSTAAFCIVVTGVSVAGGTLPACGFGILAYLVLLRIVRLMSIVDVMLANMITPVNTIAHWDLCDNCEDDASPNIRLAPRIGRCSWRSTIVILYFATVKFAMGIISIVVVSLPLLPFASAIVAHYTTAGSGEDNHLAGWEVHKFNFGTDPVWYSFTCIGYVVVGTFLSCVFGRASRAMTRSVCCVSSRADYSSRSRV